MCPLVGATSVAAVHPPVLLPRGRVCVGRIVILEVLCLLELFARIFAQIELDIYSQRGIGREVIRSARVQPLECSPPARALQCGLVGLEIDGATLRRNELSLYRTISTIPSHAYDANNQSNEWVRLGLPPPAVDDGCRTYSIIQQDDLLRLRNEAQPALVMVSGGGCSIATKTQLAQEARAAGIVVALPDNLQGHLYPPNYVRCEHESNEVSIPQMIISQDDFEDLRATLRAQGLLFSEGSMQHLPASVGSPVSNEGFTLGLPMLSLIEPLPANSECRSTSGLNFKEEREAFLQIRAKQAVSSGLMSSIVVYDGVVGVMVGDTTGRDSPKKMLYFETRERAASVKEMEFALLGLPKSSEWVLVPNFFDRSLLRNALAYECVRRAGQYAPRYRFVETFFSQDGIDANYPENYNGVYLLAEIVSRGDHRLDIPTNQVKDHFISGSDPGGFIWKVAPSHTKANSAVNAMITGTQFLPHYPKASAYTSAHWKVAQETLDNFEGSLYSVPIGSQDFLHLIDESSFIDYLLLVVEFSGGYSSLQESTHVHLTHNGRIGMGPVWDLEHGFGNAWHQLSWLPYGWRYRYKVSAAGTSSLWPNTLQWYLRIMQDAEFTEKVVARWAHLRLTVLAESHVRSLICRWKKEIRAAAARNFAQWDILNVAPHMYQNDSRTPNGVSFNVQVESLLGWVLARLAWIDSNIATIGLSASNCPCVSAYLEDPQFAAECYRTQCTWDSFQVWVGTSKSTDPTKGTVGVSAETDPQATTVPPMACLYDELFAPPPPSNSGAENVVVNEVMANGRSDAPDWVELYNTGNTPADVRGLYITDNNAQHVHYLYMDGLCPRTIPPRGYMTLVSSQNGPRILGQATTEPNLLSAISSLEPACRFDFSLKSNGDAIKLFGGSDGRALLSSLEWTQAMGGVSWGRVPNGNSNIELARPTPGTSNSKYNFLALSALSGTILINEIEADPQGGGPDWIEIFNKGSNPHDVTGMEIVDDKRSHRFVVGASPICKTIIPPRGFLVILGNNGEVGLDSRLAATASREAVCRFQFGLNRHDESVHLLAGPDSIVILDAISYRMEPTTPGYTLSRLPDGSEQFKYTPPSPGLENSLIAYQYPPPPKTVREPPTSPPLSPLSPGSVVPPPSPPLSPSPPAAPDGPPPPSISPGVLSDGSDASSQPVMIGLVAGAVFGLLCASTMAYVIWRNSLSVWVKVKDETVTGEAAQRLRGQHSNWLEERERSSTNAQHRLEMGNFLPPQHTSYPASNPLPNSPQENYAGNFSPMLGQQSPIRSSIPFSLHDPPAAKHWSFSVAPESVCGSPLPKIHLPSLPAKPRAPPELVDSSSVRPSNTLIPCSNGPASKPSGKIAPETPLPSHTASDYTSKQPSKTLTSTGPSSAQAMNYPCSSSDSDQSSSPRQGNLNNHKCEMIVPVV